MGETMGETVAAVRRIEGRTEQRSALLDRARSIAAIIEADADTIERETRITRRVHDAFVDSGLIWLPLPASHGGFDADVATCIEVVEELARADGSAGWSFFVNLAGFSGLFPFISDETLAALYDDDDHPPVLAGQLNPAGRSEKAADGYLCSGDHSFASGSAFANWICAAQIVHEDGRPVLDAGGLPRTTIALLRPEEVEFRGNWNVMGLAGTSSYDFRIEPRVVPSLRMVDGSALSPLAEPLRGNAMLRMGALIAAYALHSACALGIAKRALQEIAALASSKTRIGYTGKVVESDQFLSAFAQADIEYRAVRGRLIEAFQEAEARVAAGDKLTLEDHAVLRHTGTWTHDKAGEVVAACFRWAGTTPVRNPNALNRCMRDVLVANSHMLFDPKTRSDAGPVLVKRWLA